MDSPENGIIFGTTMAEKRLENSKVRCSAAYPTCAERGVNRNISSIPLPHVRERRVNTIVIIRRNANEWN